jgi:hypothetical protein
MFIWASDPNPDGKPLPESAMAEFKYPEVGLQDNTGVGVGVGVWAAAGTPGINNTTRTNKMRNGKNLFLFILNSFNLPDYLNHP